MTIMKKVYQRRNVDFYIAIDQNLNYLLSFQKFKSNSYCVGGRHHSSTINIVGELPFNKKTGRKIKLLVGQCALCSGKNPWL